MSPASTPRQRSRSARLGKLVLTLTLGGGGGALMAWLGAPAPWLSGAMLVVAAATLSGLPVAVPDPIRTLAFVLLGTSIGSAVTPETLAQIAAWPGSLGILTLSIIAVIAASTTYLMRVRGWDRNTARFCSIPGALSQVLIFALRSGTDLPRIALAQSLRVFVLVAVMPWLLPGGGHHGPGPAPAVESLPVGQSSGLLAAGMVVGLLLERLRVPAGALLGAMIVSAVLHGTGIVVGRLPEPLLLASFVVTGCVIGVRFGSVTFALVRNTLRGALESVVLALAISALCAAIAQQWLGLPFGQLWLAYAPGGVEAMTIMAFALNLDPAFVGAHHVVRLIVLNIVVPFWLRGTRHLPVNKDRS